MSISMESTSGIPTRRFKRKCTHLPALFTTVHKNEPCSIHTIRLAKNFSLIQLLFYTGSLIACRIGQHSEADQQAAVALGAALTFLGHY